MVAEPIQHQQTNKPNKQINVNCTYTECPITATPTTLTHNKSARRYVVTQSCIISGSRSMRSFRILLASHLVPASARNRATSINVKRPVRNSTTYSMEKFYDAHHPSKSYLVTIIMWKVQNWRSVFTRLHLLLDPVYSSQCPILQRLQHLILPPAWSARDFLLLFYFFVSQHSQRLWKRWPEGASHQIKSNRKQVSRWITTNASLWRTIIKTFFSRSIHTYNKVTFPQHT